MIDVLLVHASPFDHDPAFPLEPGPLVPIDVQAFATTFARPSFVELVGDQLGPVAGLHATIDAGHLTIVENSDPRGFENDSGNALNDAGGAHADNAAGFDAADPAEVIATTGAHSGAIDPNRAEYDANPPVTIPTPDPGAPPRRLDDGDQGRNEQPT